MSKIDEVSEKIGALHSTTKSIHRRLDNIDKTLEKQNGQVADVMKEYNLHKTKFETHLTEHKTTNRFILLIVGGISFVITIAINILSFFFRE